MARYREPFTIFPRRLRSGRTVWYYRTYSPTGERTVAHSTGKTNKTQAKNYCAELLAQGLLYTGAEVSFLAYAEHFYDDDSPWMLDKKQTRGDSFTLSKSTLTIYRYSLYKHLIPFFGKMKLYEINTAHIKKYRAKLVEGGFSNNTINTSVACLKVIIKQAIADRYITHDPFITIKPMFIAAHERDAFTLQELISMFTKDWGRDSEVKYFAVIAAVTGMRISEVFAIRKEHLYKTYLDVSDQIDKNGELIPVKTNEARKLRISSTLFKIINDLIKSNGFAFNLRGTKLRECFYEHCGVSEKERKSRKLTFHSLRHFFNTYLLANNISEIKVKAMMGHSSGKGSMTERYANFRPEHFDDIAELQEKLLKDFGISIQDVTLPPH